MLLQLWRHQRVSRLRSILECFLAAARLRRLVQLCDLQWLLLFIKLTWDYCKAYGLVSGAERELVLGEILCDLPEW